MGTVIDINRVFRDNGERTPDGNCYEFSDLLDGFVVHGDSCPYAGKAWLGGGSSCINFKRWQGPYPEWVDKRYR